MGEFVYIYVKEREFRRNEAEKDNGKNAGATQTIGVEGLDDFYFSLENLRNGNVKIARLDISSHGAPGVLDFRGDQLDSTNLMKFKGKGFEDLFDVDARILIYGCNVAGVGKDPRNPYARESNGREFLTEVARVFLFKGGGRVIGSTKITTTVPLLGKTYFPDNVTVLIKKGGTNTRIAAGDQLTRPDGVWLVKAYGLTYIYQFTYQGDRVKWTLAKSLFEDETGEGRWSRVGDLLRIAWDSGSFEEWDLPLFDKEQSGACHPKGGQIYPLIAQLSNSSWGY